MAAPHLWPRHWSFGYNPRMTPMTKPFIFISCGQYLHEEKRLGMQIKTLVEELTPFDGYFAEDQSSVNGLVANILERLYNCAGLIAVMHPRGSVTDDHGIASVRASVWIEQEIAIAAIIQQVIRKDREELQSAAYVHKTIRREGIRTLIQLNPVPFENDDLIIADLRQKLPTWRGSQSTALRNLRFNEYRGRMRLLCPEHVEALRILTLDGQTNDYIALGKLREKGLATNWGGLFEGLANTSNLIQPVPSQPHRIFPDKKMWEIKPEAKEVLEQYFVENQIG